MSDGGKQKKNNNNNNSIVEKLLISYPSVPSLRSVFLSLNPHNNNNNINGFIGGLNRSRHVTITSAAIERPQKSTTILPFSPFPSSGQFARQSCVTAIPRIPEKLFNVSILFVRFVGTRFFPTFPEPWFVLV